jgi:hypothetical protein
MAASPLVTSRSIRWPWVMARKRATEAMGSGILPGRSEHPSTLSAAGRAASPENALSGPARAVLSPEGPWVGGLARTPRSHRPSNAVSSPMPCSAWRAARLFLATELRIARRNEDRTLIQMCEIDALGILYCGSPPRRDRARAAALRTSPSMPAGATRASGIHTYDQLQRDTIMVDGAEGAPRLRPQRCRLVGHLTS